MRLFQAIPIHQVLKTKILCSWIFVHGSKSVTFTTNCFTKMIKQVFAFIVCTFWCAHRHIFCFPHSGWLLVPCTNLVPSSHPGGWINNNCMIRSEMPIWPPEPQQHISVKTFKYSKIWHNNRHLYGGYTSVVITNTNAYIVLKPGPWVLNDSL